MRKYRLIGTFFIVVLCCFLLEIVTVCIPQKAIQKHCEESAVFYSNRFLFPQQMAGYQNTTLDYYADCILLNVIYEMDAKKPVQSVIQASYYDFANSNTDTDLMEAVYAGKVANVSYGRYWHGSMIYLRPLLCIMNMQEIYQLLTWLLIGGLLSVCGWLIFKREYTVSLCLLLSFLLTGGFWMAGCVEYVNTAFLMLVMILLFVKAGEKGEQKLLSLCVISGILTCFMDFLTAETITITVPLLCVLCTNRYHAKGAVEKRKLAVTGGIAWGLSYAVMFLVKWMLCLGVLGRESFLDSLHRSGSYMKGNFLQSIIKNISMLFPIKESADTYIPGGCAAAFLISFMIICILIIRQRGVQSVSVFLLLAVVPYLRFAFLSGHSDRHSFFTYRAQMCTIFIFIYFIIHIRKDFIAKNRGKHHEADK